MLLEAGQHCEESQSNSPDKRILLSSKQIQYLLLLCSSLLITAQTTTGDDVKDFAKQLKNKITRKYRNKPPKKTYLDYTIETDAVEGEERDTGESLVFNNVHTRINNMAER